MIVPKFLTCSRLGFLGGVNMPRSVLALRPPYRCVHGFLPAKWEFWEILGSVVFAVSLSSVAISPFLGYYDNLFCEGVKRGHVLWFCECIFIHRVTKEYEQSCNVLLTCLPSSENMNNTKCRVNNVYRQFPVKSPPFWDNEKFLLEKFWRQINYFRLQSKFYLARYSIFNSAYEQDLPSS